MPSASAAFCFSAIAIIRMPGSIAALNSENPTDRKSQDMQAWMLSLNSEWKGHMEHLAAQILHEHREAIYRTSGWSSFLKGMVFTMIVVVAIWVGSILHRSRKEVLAKESKAEVVLARYDHDSVRRLLAEVTHNKTLPGWLSFPDFQRVDWINSLIEQMWPKLSAAIVTQVHQTLQPKLKASKPKWIGDITLPQFTLGSSPPRIKGVKTFGGNTGDDLALELDGVWASSMIVALKIKLLPERIPLLPASINLTAFLTKYLSKLIFVKMAITDVGFSGRVRVVLTGLSNTLPLVDTLQVSLVELPRFSFGIRLLEYLNLMVLPGLESFVHYFIRDVLLAPYTLPEALTIPIKDGASSRHPMPVGMLFVKVIEATNIPNVDWRSLVSKPDCFVELSVRNKTSKTTRVIWNKKCPRWDEVFKFLVHFPEHQELQLVLRDYDRVLGATEVGRAHVPIKGMPPNEERQLWVEIQPSHKGFGSLRALTSAMDAMKNASSSVTAGHGARVARVEDAGGMGFADVYSGAPQVQEIVPPSEMESDDEASLTVEASSIAGGEGGGAGAASAEQPAELSDVAVAPGVCTSRGKCAPADDSQEATTVSPTEGGGSGGAHHISQATESRRSSGEYSAAPSTVAPSTDSRQSTLDATVAAARKQKRKEPCKLHLSFTYIQVGQDTVQKARTSGAQSELAPGSTEAQVLSALRGGVLEVKVRRESLESTTPTARQVVVKVGNHKKATEAAGGRKNDNVKALDLQEEVLEFVVDGDVADQPGTHVELQVFDMHWISDTSDVALWGLESKHQMPTEPATVSLPFADIVRSRSLHKAWKVGGSGGSRTPLLLDVEFEWLPAMETF